jgi:hypothetical protein
MADKEEFSLDLSASVSSAQTAGDEEFSLQPCTKAEESAPKRKKAPAAGLDGCAQKKKAEEGSEEEPWRAVDSQLTVPEGEEVYDMDHEEFMVGLRARFAAKVERMLANTPNVMLVDFPACCVRPPGVEFPKSACTLRSDGQNNATSEE